MKDEKTQTGAPARSAQDVRQKGEEALEHAKSAAHEAVDTSRARAEEGLTQGKNVMAHQVLCAAHAAKTAADDLRKQEQGMLADWADVAADGMTRAAEGLESSDLNELYHRVEDYARRQPAVFLAGIALAGFAAARFAKAARENSAYRQRTASTPTYTEVNHV